MIIATEKDLKQRTKINGKKSQTIKVPDSPNLGIKSLTPKSDNSPNLTIHLPIKIKRKSIFDENNKNHTPTVTEENLNNKNLNENIRKDQMGIPIMKQSKLHKIMFCDKLNDKKSLTEIIEVESFKQYNVIDEDEKKHTSKNVSCRCIIF